MFHFSWLASLTYVFSPRYPAPKSLFLLSSIQKRYQSRLFRTTIQVRDGFSHSDIFGSSLVCQLPKAFRRLLRPSSLPTAKAFTVCAYYLDSITLNRLLFVSLSLVFVSIWANGCSPLSSDLQSSLSPVSSRIRFHQKAFLGSSKLRRFSFFTQRHLFRRLFGARCTRAPSFFLLSLFLSFKDLLLLLTFRLLSADFKLLHFSLSKKNEGDRLHPPSHLIFIF